MRIHGFLFSLLFITPIQSSAFRVDLWVRNGDCRLLLTEKQPQLDLVIENSSRSVVITRIVVELMDPDNQVLSRAEKEVTVPPGTYTANLALSIPATALDRDHERLAWYRVRYRLHPSLPVTKEDRTVEGILPLSEITPDLFALRIVAPGKAHPGTRFCAWLQAFSPTSLSPRPGIAIRGEIQYVDERTGLPATGKAITDATGYAAIYFDIPSDTRATEAELKVSASSGNIVQRAELDFEIDHEPEILITSDKPLYQPGQVLQLRALIFDAAKKALAGRPVAFKISDPEGRVIFTTDARNTSRFGVAHADWLIPANARLGNYDIEVASESSSDEPSMASHSVVVSRYELPTFTVRADSNRPYYLPGQQAKVEVQANYLFGQPVKNGRIRIVHEEERRWNVQTQTWEIDEAEQFEGDTDSTGKFMASIDLSSDHDELEDSDHEPYRDRTYAVYFTDLTTGRTESSRFDLRATKRDIHIYLTDPSMPHNQPLEFYLQSLYADGTPAKCEVTIRGLDDKEERIVQRVNTNSYGVAKIRTHQVSAVRHHEGYYAISLRLEARDSQGRTGEHSERLGFPSRPQIRLSTNKAIYRPGEPIQLEISASKDMPVLLYATTRNQFLSSQVVQLRNGSASLALPYEDRFKSEITLVASSAEGEKYETPFDARTVLYPSGDDLKLEVRTSQSAYRPGEEARIDFQTRAADGSPLLSALGVAVIDKAVDERARPDRVSGSYDPFRWHTAGNEVAGFRLDDLRRIDLSKPIPPGLDLVAEMVLQRPYFDEFLSISESQGHKQNPRAVFARFFERQFKSTDVSAALAKRSRGNFPQNKNELAQALLESGIELQKLLDPWGRNYYPVFETRHEKFDLVGYEDYSTFGSPPARRTNSNTASRQLGYVVLRSVGLDGQQGTRDDFEVTPRFSGLIQAKSETSKEPTIRVNERSMAGRIGGMVTDATGAFIPGVRVRAVLEGSSLSYEAASNEDGRYLLLHLPIGLYEVRFDLPGFRNSIVDYVPVYDSKLTRVDATLQIGSISETVSVSAEGFSSQTATASIGRAEGPGTTPRLREYFPETLLWKPSIETDSQGQAHVRFKLPDSITTWKVAVMGSTLDGKVKTTDIEFRTFQPFFIEYDPPPFLTQGDEIALPVVLRNYLDTRQGVKLALRPENWFRFLGPAEKQISVERAGAARETFDFRALKFTPEASLRFTAASPAASDAIEKRIRVIPDGDEVAETHAELFAGSVTLETVIPESFIPGTLHSELKLYTDPFAHALEGIEGILQRPYGCAEQTISSTYPSLIVLRYLKPFPEDYSGYYLKALRFARKGYERLLGYQAESGGFSYWGHGSANLALTAYAVKFLQDVAPFVRVDEKVLNGARQWLVNQQKPGGSWADDGQWHRDPSSNEASITAYIAHVLGETPGHRGSRSAGEPGASGSREPIKPALDYLFDRGKIDDPYVLSFLAMAALDAGESARALQAIGKLRAQARFDKESAYWEHQQRTPFYGWGRTARIETTALVVRALLHSRELVPDPGVDQLIRQGLLFLIREKDRYGVWHSTRATIEVLDALVAAGGSFLAQQRVKGPVEVFANNKKVTHDGPQSTSRLPWTVDLTRYFVSGGNKIKIQLAAESLASAQLISTYYVPWSSSPAKRRQNTGLSLSVNFSGKTVTLGEQVTCSVQAERVTSQGYGMMLAEIGLPPGSDVDHSTLERAKQNHHLAQYDVLPDRVIVYLWPASGKTSFEFKFRPRFGMKAKTVRSLLYDYYNPEEVAGVAPTEIIVR